MEKGKKKKKKRGGGGVPGGRQWNRSESDANEADEEDCSRVSIGRLQMHLRTEAVGCL